MRLPGREASRQAEHICLLLDESIPHAPNVLLVRLMMATLNGTSAPRPVWIRNSTLLAAGVATVLLATAWWMLLVGRPTRSSLALAVSAALLSGSAYAFNARPQSGRLLGFGSKYVQVRSPDEWTLYQYGLLFDESSPEQQDEALTHYRVGLRLFPTRPQDMAQKQSSWQWLLSLLTLCAVITLSEAVHGWYHFLIFVALYAWMWGCMRMSRRFIDAPATSPLTELHLR